MALDLVLYGDESGTRNSKISLVSAYVANRRSWNALHKEWLALLSDKRLNEFHAVDFFTRKYSGTGSTGNNPFATWTDEDATIFVEDMGRIIRRHRRGIRPLLALVDVDAFNSLSYGERRALTSGRFKFWEHSQHRKWASDGKPTEPYMLAFQVVVKRALEMCPPTAKLHLVFDINRNVEGAATRLAADIVNLKLWPEYDRLHKDIKFGDSVTFPGIQLADLRGYLVNRWDALGQSNMGAEQLWALSRINGFTIEYERLDAEHLERTLSFNLTDAHRSWLKSR